MSTEESRPVCVMDHFSASPPSRDKTERVVFTAFLSDRIRSQQFRLFTQFLTREVAGIVRPSRHAFGTTLYQPHLCGNCSCDCSPQEVKLIVVNQQACRPYVKRSR